MTSSHPRRLLVAPDKFKGSLTASEVAEFIARGLESQGVEAVRLPLADGGDGSVDAAVAAGFERRSVPGGGAFALDPSHRVAVVEVANTCGIVLKGSADPLGASSDLFGAAVVEALRERPAHVVLALGGSASTDGGTGLLRALGYRFMDRDGRDLPPGGGPLADLHEVRPPNRSPIAGLRVTVACDVENTLLGEHGAAVEFAPQKGADGPQVRRLEEGLRRLAVAMETAEPGRAAPEAPGSGAAGGLGYAALHLGATMVSGAGFFLDLLGFERQLDGCDAVVTGEGCIDDQTLRGKLPAVVRARSGGVPVHVVVGRDALSDRGRRLLDVHDVIALEGLTDADPYRDPELAGRLLTRVGRRLAMPG